MLKTENATYTCIRDCFYQNKLFKQGEPFPENWLKAGVPVGKHFAKTTEAHEIILTGKLKTQVICHGDDPRSNVELRKILKDHGIEDAENWTRKDMWEAVIGWEKAPAQKKSTGKEK
jgi:hypothetical protein